MSVTSIPILTLTAVAVGAVTEHRFVGYDGAQATVLGQKAQGVATSSELSGAAIAVDVLGTTVIEVGEAIAVGDDLTPSITGKGVKPTLAGHRIRARALTAAAADGDLVEALLIESKE